MSSKDFFSDGLCCGAGYGYYDVDVQNEDGSWRSAVRGRKFAGMISHMIGEHKHHRSYSKHANFFFSKTLIIFPKLFKDVGRTESTMTGRDKAYLIAHNKRRLEWHSRYNKAYVPLKWSKGELSSFLFAIFSGCLFLTHLPLL